MPLSPVLTKRFGTDQPWRIENYERLDGYAGLRKALSMQPDEITAIVKDSNLRGRGGAGFILIQQRVVGNVAITDGLRFLTFEADDLIEPRCEGCKIVPFARFLPNSLSARAGARQFLDK